MARKKGLMAAAAAFAASPQGRKLIQQAKDYANRPETKQKAKQLVEQVQAKRKARGSSSPQQRWQPQTRPDDAPPYGTPPRS